MPDAFAFTQKAPFMQRLSDVVRTGHNRYVEGSIAVEKAASLAGKLDLVYHFSQTKLQASRQRKSGFASFRMLMYLGDGESSVHWFLLRTEGDVPTEAAREKWRDAFTDRVKLTGYELVRLSRPGSNTPAYTWRYERTRCDDLRDALLMAIRTKRDDSLRQLIHTLWRTPGFAGARAQVKKFADLIKAEWKRSRGSDVMPEIPARLGYVRRLADKGVKLKKEGAK